MAKGYRHFTQEFKDSAVREVVERSRRVDEVANQVGIYEGTLRRWVRAWREQYGDERVEAAGDGRPPGGGGSGRPGGGVGEGEPAPARA
ncbi:transposase [Catenulispora yoronensis]